MQFKRIKRPINGVLLLDKPVGYSSNQALQVVKRLFTAAKAGHTGNLDPFATGLLPICLGEATKFSHQLLDADKSYIATLQLGVTTTTGDTEGDVTSRSSINVLRADFERVMHSFLGDIQQTPPMHSALKHQGKPLYEYARAGVEIERKSRPVTIHNIALQTFNGDQAEIIVTCSKGTYIRVLAEDIGKELGCGAHLIALRRTTTGGFMLKDALTLEALENQSATQRDAHLLPVDALVSELPEIELDADSTHYFRQGQAVWKTGMSKLGMTRVYAPEHIFLGLGENMGDGQINPRRLLVL
ncbi:MAG: tRNA pseudouridine(55) synthase TruB [Methylophilales bacterium]|nr:tRNA pseudouridine(55) synthase TruB [Methylophilales bacterium]